MENHKLYVRTQREKEKAAVAGLNAEAVKQFREVFNDCKPENSDKVSIGVILSLFAYLLRVRKYENGRFGGPNGRFGGPNGRFGFRKGTKTNGYEKECKSHAKAEESY